MPLPPPPQPTHPPPLPQLMAAVVTRTLLNVMFASRLTSPFLLIIISLQYNVQGTDGVNY